MPTLIFATNNPKKAEEIRAALKAGWEIKTLKEAGIDIDIPEPFDTLEENAREKSRVISNITGADCFSEDTGLEVAFLNGAPGVRSARYAGEHRSFEANIDKLLTDLEGKLNRHARFRTIISCLYQNTEYQFEGVCNGIIIDKRRGKGGFGYDPVFVPEGDTRTFAEMSLADKNRYSHRKKALDKLISFLQDKQQGLR